MPSSTTLRLMQTSHPTAPTVQASTCSMLDAKPGRFWQEFLAEKWIHFISAIHLAAVLSQTLQLFHHHFWWNFCRKKTSHTLTGGVSIVWTCESPLTGLSSTGFATVPPSPSPHLQRTHAARQPALGPAAQQARGRAL